MCYTPITLKDLQIDVPCGKCKKCLARRASGWSFRLMQQDKIARSAYFLTLTYANENVCLTKNKFLSLCKRDVQLFLKRLRKSQFGNSTNHAFPIKYYAVGEYGSKTKRPHYHLIIFNANIELIQPAWDLGNVYFGTVTGASVGYCLKYMTKKPQSQFIAMMTDLKSSLCSQRDWGLTM